MATCDVMQMVQVKM